MINTYNLSMKNPATAIFFAIKCVRIMSYVFEFIRRSQSIAMIILALVTTGAFADSDSQRQKVLEQSLKNHAQQAVIDYARERGWRHYELDVTPWVPGLSASQLACDTDVEMVPAQPNGRLWGRVSYELSCPSPAWRIRARADVKLNLAVVVSARTLGKEEKLTADTMTLKTRDVSRIFTDFVTDKRQLSGRQLIRRVRSGQPLSLAMTAEPYWVEANGRILIRINQGGIVASMPGLSLDNGSKGDAVRVRNPSSGKVVTAWVVDRGVVETSF